MTIGKIPFFLTIFLLLAIPFVVPRLIWLARSRTITGVMGFEGRGTAGEQFPLTYSYVYFQPGVTLIYFAAPPGLGYRHGDPVPVRYLPDKVTDARVNSFLGLWGDVLVYGGIPEFILLICFLHRRLVPWGSRVRLTAGRPFIRIFTNEFPI
jgi:hypothetical protein